VIRNVINGLLIPRDLFYFQDILELLIM
jgi:hypothetical protein